ncbi:MAG: chromosome partitioning protein ParB, partial [Rhodobacterales bacterium]
GRIAVMAAGQGAFGSVEEAVNALFHAGSKAKRSKIRAFAALHEELGDLLSFAHELSERQGLRIVAAIRAGMAAELRQALAADQLTGDAGDALREWALMEPVVIRAEALDKPEKAPGRPRSKLPRSAKHGGGYVRLANGITLQRDTDDRGHTIRLEGHAVNDDLIEVVMDELQRLLETM